MNTELEARKAHIRHTRRERQSRELRGKMRGKGCLPGLLLIVLFLAGCTAWGFAPLPTATPTPATATSSPAATREPTNTATAQFSTHVENSTPTPAACVVDHTGGEVLNVRKGPGLDSEIIGGLMPGAKVTVITWGDAWLQISNGYIARKYCEAR